MATHSPAPSALRWPRTDADYIAVITAARAAIAPDQDRLARAAALIDALWNAFGSAIGPDDRGYSWVGVYLAPGQPVPERFAGNSTAIVPQNHMILGPRRNKPACSPIGLQGMCGRSCLERAAIIVDDVRTLGHNYIACDPRDQSELVIPLFEPDPTTGPDHHLCWGVLDVDSYAVAAFTRDEPRWLWDACVSISLTSVPALHPDGPPLLML